MPFKNKEQEKACYAADDPNWDCKKYAKGEDNEEENDDEEENEETFDKTVEVILKQNE